jgi:hypothetical protein
MKVSVNRRFSMLSQNAALLVIYSCPRYLKALLVLYIQPTKHAIN